jgi:hypothetical protein
MSLGVIVRRRTQPIAVYIVRLTATATFAYLLALHVPAGTSRPVLAPLTALLVLQASLFQTIRSGFRKVVSVAAGVLVAVALSAFVDFNWWVLGLLIGGALLIGHVLRLGGDILEVPISAMLIFSSVGAHAAATGRIVDTLVGTFAGLAGGLVFAPLRVQPARAAVGELAGQLADLLNRMAGDLHAGADGDSCGEVDLTRVSDWLTQARALRGEIERVDDTLRQAEDSTRLNPRALLPDTLPESETALRGGLEALEHAALTLRSLARSLLDATRVPSEASPVRDPETKARLAAVLTQLASAIRVYGGLVQTLPSRDSALEAALSDRLTEALRQQDLLADILEPRRVPEGASTEWPLRGEILSHVDRLRTGLAMDTMPRAISRRRGVRQWPPRRRENRRQSRHETRHQPRHARRQRPKASRPRDITPTR